MWFWLEKHGDDIAAAWIIHMIMGDTDAAVVTLRPIDEARDFDDLMNYLSYPNFDPTAYPNFMEHMAGQGLEARTLIAPPCRCNR